MNSTVLSADMKQRLLAAFGIPPGGYNDAAMQKACDAIAAAVVSHIQTSGVVVVAVTGVTVGAGTAPGTGTVT